MRTLLHPVTGQDRVWVEDLPSRPNGGLQLVTAARPAVEANVRPANSGIMQIIRPSARDRWVGTSLQHYTPERVEQICRGAMAGNLVAQWEMFSLMEETWPRLLKNEMELKDAVVALEWNVQPWAAKGAKPTAEAQKRADFVEDLLWNGFNPDADANENDFEDTIRDLLDARFKGICALETDWMMGESGFGPAITPRCTRWVHPRNYGYPGDLGHEDRLMLDLREVFADGHMGDGARGATRPTLDGDGQWARFPENKFIIGISKTKSGHPISGALLRTLGFWWAASNFAGEWLVNFVQVFGMPIRWCHYDPNISREELAKLLDMLENMGSSSYGAFPSGVTFELKEAAKASGGQNPHIALLDLADKVCDILILRQTLTTEVGSTGGNRALGEVHEGVLDGVKLAVASWAATRLNQQLIKPMVLLNFGDTKEMPWLMPSLAKDKNAMADHHGKLIGMGLEISREWLHEIHEVPMPADNDDVVARPEPVANDQGQKPNDKSKAKKVNAKQATTDHTDGTDEKLANAVLERLVGVEAKWLGGVQPFFVELVNLAADEGVSEKEFEAALVQARARIPDLFAKLDTAALAEAMEETMGAAVINGAVKGYMKRGGAK